MVDVARHEKVKPSCLKISVACHSILLFLISCVYLKRRQINLWVLSAWPRQELATYKLVSGTTV